MTGAPGGWKVGGCPSSSAGQGKSPKAGVEILGFPGVSLWRVELKGGKGKSPLFRDVGK